MRRFVFLAALFCIPVFAAPESRPAEKEPFPAVEDWSSLHIRLERGSCAEVCPVYSIEIDGDGTVVYTGEDHVLVKGRRTAHISKDKVRELVKKFAKAEFFWTFTFYEGPDGAPTDRLGISFDGREHAVSDQGGSSPVAALYEAIDKAAGTEKWVMGEAPRDKPKPDKAKSAKPPEAGK